MPTTKILTKQEQTNLKASFDQRMIVLVLVLLILVFYVLYACFVELTFGIGIAIFFSLIALNPTFNSALKHYQDLTFKTKLVFPKIVQEKEIDNGHYLIFEHDFLMERCAVKPSVFKRVRAGDTVYIERTQYTEKILGVQMEK